MQHSFNLVREGGKNYRDIFMRLIIVGGYPKNSDNYPNTSGDLITFEYTVRAQRDSDALRK
jgi:hypothetical protein